MILGKETGSDVHELVKQYWVMYLLFKINRMSALNSEIWNNILFMFISSTLLGNGQYPVKVLNDNKCF